MRVDQFVTGFAPRDAIGNHTLQVRKALRAAGYSSDIYAQEAHAPLDLESRPYWEHRSAPGDGLLLYQCSTNSAIGPWLATQAALGHRVALQYHNITPGLYFERWHRPTALALDEGRRQLAELVPLVDLTMAVSPFNAAELESLGCSDVQVCPLLVDLGAYRVPPDTKLLAKLQRARARSGPHWLFVGRFAPNKCQHDVIAAFAVYQRQFEPTAKLVLAGSSAQPRYRWALERLAYQLGVRSQVEFVDAASDTQLLAYWAVADLFVCLSEHEGFCVPLLEAMELGVPVLAYGAGAVPGTLGRAGVLLAGKKPLDVARAAADLGHAAQRRQELVDLGHRRAREFSLDKSSARLVSAVTSYLERVS